MARLLRLLLEEDWIGEFKLSQNQIMIHSRVVDTISTITGRKIDGGNYWST
jgi:hypothetical protein